MHSTQNPRDKPASTWSSPDHAEKTLRKYPSLPPSPFTRPPIPGTPASSAAARQHADESPSPPLTHPLQLSPRETPPPPLPRSEATAAASPSTKTLQEPGRGGGHGSVVRRRRGVYEGQGRLQDRYSEQKSVGQVRLTCA